MSARRKASRLGEVAGVGNQGRFRYNLVPHTPRMPRFRDLSIRTKLMTGFMLTSLVALLITMAALGVYDRNALREEALRDARVLGGVIGENAATSIAFNDPQTARSTLAALRSQPHILSGYLYDNDGRLFASYATQSVQPPAKMPGDGSTMTDGVVQRYPRRHGGHLRRSRRSQRAAAALHRDRRSGTGGRVAHRIATGRRLPKGHLPSDQGAPDHREARVAGEGLLAARDEDR